LKRPARIGAALAAAAAVIAVAAPSALAQATDFTLGLSTQSEAVVGRPLMIQATGTIPADQVWFPYFFSLDAIPTTVTTTCPPDRWEGVQFAQANGGSVVVLSQTERPDAAGNFSVPVAVTPSAPGQVLLCGYTDDGEALTLAAASMILDIKPPPSSGGAPPPSGPGQPGGSSRPPSPPAYTAQGIRMCRAVLAGKDARSCIRKIVRTANARCRRLHSHHARTRCLKAVRRAKQTNS
jgi:hypothetical protein